VRALRATPALLALAAVLAGCGSYTRKDFITAADAICSSTQRQTRAIPPPTASTLPALGAYLGHVVPVLQAESKQIRALGRPVQTTAERIALDSYLTALSQSVTGYKQLQAAAAANDAKAVASAEAALRANEVASLAANYGLRSCGTPGATVA
jgi:hypothetical protein